MKRILLGGITAAFVAFIWGAFVWMQLGIYDNSLKPLPNEAELLRPMKVAGLETGVYLAPYWVEGMSDEEKVAFNRRHKEGPLVRIFYHAEGKPVSMVPQMIKGFLINLLSCLVLAYLLSRAASRMPSYAQRVMYVFLIGVFVCLVGPVMEWNWFHVSPDYLVSQAIDYLVGILLVGLVLAGIIKSPA